jgi:predicted dehydrogenase
VWNPDQPTSENFRAQWDHVPDNQVFDNGFRVQWEDFIRDVDLGRPHRFDLMAGVRGLRLVEAGLESSAQGRRVALERLER